MCEGGGGDSGGGFDSGGVGGDVSFDNNPGGTDDRYSSDHHHHHSYERTTHYNNHNSKSFFSKLPFSVVICVFVMPMIIAFGVGIYLLTDVISDVNRWISTVGTVIDRNSCGCSSSGTSTGCTTTYVPVIEYIVDGISYQFTSSACSNPSVGNPIKVLYDPNDPSDARDGSFTSLWMAPIIALVIGVTSAGGLVFIIRKKLLERKEHQQQSTGMNFNSPDAIQGSTGTNSALGDYSGNATTSVPIVPNPEPSAPGYSTSIPYAETETKYDENKKPSLFDQLQANAKY